MFVRRIGLSILSMIQGDGKIEDDVSQRIGAGWIKWRLASEVLCGRKVPLKLKRQILQSGSQSSHAVWS